MNKTRTIRNARRAVSTLVVSLTLTLAATAAPALANYSSWAG